MAVGTWQVSGALRGKHLLFPVVVFPEFWGSPQIASGQEAPNRCTAPTENKGGGREEALGGSCALWQTLCNSVPVFAEARTCLRGKHNRH